jgi:hypothetical protein
MTPKSISEETKVKLTVKQFSWLISTIVVSVISIMIFFYSFFEKLSTADAELKVKIVKIETQIFYMQMVLFEDNAAEKEGYKKAILDSQMEEFNMRGGNTIKPKILK